MLSAKFFSSCNARWARRSLVWSRKTSTTPMTTPFLSLIGAPLSAIGISFPSLEMRIVWLASPIIIPSESTRETGLGTGVLESSLRIRKTSSIVFPRASASVHPVRFSATGFIYLIIALRSVVITASPMLYKVVRNSDSACHALL